MNSAAPHIVVCGAGVIGAATAYCLSLRGARVTIVEEGNVAGAASGKAGGFLALDWCDATPLAQLARTSFALHQQWAIKYGARYDFRLMNTYAVGSGGYPEGSSGEVSWLSDSYGIRGQLGDEKTTAQVHPRKFTRTLIEMALNNGAELVRGRVEAIESTRARVSGVRVDGNLLPCDIAVIALGPWSGSGLPGVPLPAVYGLKGHSVTFTPSAPLPAHALFVESMTIGGTISDPEVVARSDGTVYLCAISEQVRLPAKARDVAPREDATELLASFAKSLSPRFRTSEIGPATACFRPVYNDGLPRMGPVPDLEGAYLACGHSCWGILNAPASGMAMAELILDGASTTVDLRPFAV